MAAQPKRAVAHWRWWPGAAAAYLLASGNASTRHACILMYSFFLNEAQCFNDPAIWWHIHTHRSSLITLIIWYLLSSHAFIYTYTVPLSSLSNLIFALISRNSCVLIWPRSCHWFSRTNSTPRCPFVTGITLSPIFTEPFAHTHTHMHAHPHTQVLTRKRQS